MLFEGFQHPAEASLSHKHTCTLISITHEDSDVSIEKNAALPEMFNLRRKCAWHRSSLCAQEFTDSRPEAQYNLLTLQTLFLGVAEDVTWWSYFNTEQLNSCVSLLFNKHTEHERHNSEGCQLVLNKQLCGEADEQEAHSSALLHAV